MLLAIKDKDDIYRMPEPGWKWLNSEKKEKVVKR